MGVAVVNMPYYAPIVLANQLTTTPTCRTGGSTSAWGSGGCRRSWRPSAGRPSAVEPAPTTTSAASGHSGPTRSWTTRGEFHRVPRSRVDPKPLQQPHPPVLLGGGADAALRRAGRSADGWISSSQADLSHIDRSIETVRRGAVDAGRDPDGLRFVCRGVVKVHTSPGAPLVGSLDEIRSDCRTWRLRGSPRPSST